MGFNKPLDKNKNNRMNYKKHSYIPHEEENWDRYHSKESHNHLSISKTHRNTKTQNFICESEGKSEISFDKVRISSFKYKA